MKANELRIGNLVLYQGYHISTVIGITEPYWGHGIRIHHDGSSVGCAFDMVEPIHLTEEWLYRFGFEVGYHKLGTSTQKFYSKLWGTNGVEIVVVDYHYTGFEYQLSKSNYKYLEYVHQLQNLFFALTGEELTLQP